MSTTNYVQLLPATGWYFITVDDWHNTHSTAVASWALKEGSADVIGLIGEVTTKDGPPKLVPVPAIPGVYKHESTMSSIELAGRRAKEPFATAGLSEIKLLSGNAPNDIQKLDQFGDAVKKEMSSRLATIVQLDECQRIMSIDQLNAAEDSIIGIRHLMATVKEIAEFLRNGKLSGRALALQQEAQDLADMATVRYQAVVKLSLAPVPEC